MELTSDDMAFRLHVVESLSRLETSGTEIVRRLSELNGKVAQHERRVGIVEAHIQAREDHCPLADLVHREVEATERKLATAEAKNDLAQIWLNALRPKVEDAELKLTADAARAQNSAKWWAGLKPLLLLAAGAFVALILVHSKEMLKALGVG